MYKNGKDSLGNDRWHCDETEISAPIMVIDANGNQFPLDSPEGMRALEEFRALNMEGPQTALEKFMIHAS